MNIKTSLTCFSGFLLIFLSRWIEHNFGLVTIDQIYFTLDLGFKGLSSLGAVDATYFKTFFIQCVLTSLITTLFLCAAQRYIMILRKYHFSSLILLSGLIYFGWQVSLGDYLIKLILHKPDYIAINYISPDKAKLKIQNPKSLVLIYIEGLENGYADKELFNRNLLRKLTVPDKHAFSFQKYIQMPGTQWTIAALVATQCAIPLNLVTVYGHNHQDEHFPQFLPGAKCLGDILAEQGYKNVYMNGSSLHTCGVEKFLQDHHYTELYGKEEWLAQGKSEAEMNDWGLYDDDLFAQAKLKLTELVQSKQLFNLTLLTIDTHGPNGFISKTCRKQGYNDFTGVVECTANQVADFVTFIRAKGWLKQMNVVILGDHLAMENPAYDLLDSKRNRSIFNRFISEDILSPNTPRVVHFDMLPTILDSIGFHYENGRLGLGYSGFSPSQSIQPSKRIIEMDRNVGNNSLAYKKMWLSSSINKV